MYEALKKIGYNFIPKKFIKKNEAFFRKIISIKYIGNNYQCNICGFNMSHFVIQNDGKKICPKCGSLSRNRRLWELIKTEVENKSILHFSPPKSISNRIKQLPHTKYITTDFEKVFDAIKNYDIENIDEKNNSFDLIICYHVLEHINKDTKAMSELYRILKPNGECYIQTPFKEGEIFEDSSIKSPEARLKHFGQEDHLRIYSVKGLKNRLENAKFIVEVKNFKEESDNKFGFNEDETILIAKKEIK